MDVGRKEQRADQLLATSSSSTSHTHLRIEVSRTAANTKTTGIHLLWCVDTPACNRKPVEAKDRPGAHRQLTWPLLPETDIFLRDTRDFESCRDAEQERDGSLDGGRSLGRVWLGQRRRPVGGSGELAERKKHKEQPRGHTCDRRPDSPVA